MRALLAVLLFLGDLHYRWIGPAVMGGRLDAVAGIPGRANVVYLGHSTGGLWKSLDGGLTFSSAFEAGSSSAVGAIAVDPKNANRLYIGTGEPFPRNTAESGDGIWTSPDAGKHWQHLGLERSGSIARIVIDPANPRILLAAAMGTEFVPGGERGIYRSSDGGVHWLRVLYVNETTGGSDLALDPRRPNVLYAGTFDYQRFPWTFRSGGPGSGLYRSTDTGRTWTRLTGTAGKNGLPSGDIDRVGVSICGDTRVVYAFVPNRKGLLYRSTDDGAHWSLRNTKESIDFRPFYFSQVRCDPKNAQKVYALAGDLSVSTNGGRSFSTFDAGGGDNHDLWIDPLDTRRLLSASDLGFRFSVDGGKTWNNDNVVPFAQVYRVGYDFDEPYHVMGGLQDHEVWWGPNEVLNANDGVSNGDWLNISDWGDGQYAAADPRDASIVYEDTHFGDLARLDLKTKQRQYISPRPSIQFGAPASAAPYRFNWSAPLLVSKYDPNVLYFGANVLFRSSDAGNSWIEFSPDLTKCRPAWLGPSGGPVTQDYTNAETYCTITSIGEDGVDRKTVWYGTDDGHLEITADNGRTWTDAIANVSGIPAGIRVNCISPSPSSSGVAYAALDAHETGDDRAYAYVTRDGGKTWRSISAGLSGYVHVVREDPRNPAVLYAGTETGTFVSFDSGAHWDDLRLGLPHLPVYDLQVHPRDNDLIIASHARGFYILDDLTPLQQYGSSVGKDAYLFTPVPAIRYATATYHEYGRGAFVADNKPYGVLLSLYLAKAPAAKDGKPRVRVHVFSQGKEIDGFDVRVHAGLNRFSWDLSTQAPGPVQDTRSYYVFYPMSIAGPQVLPGMYTLSVDLPRGPLSVPVSVVLNPHESATTAQLQMQYDALERLAALQERAETAIAKLSAIERKSGSNPHTGALLDRLRNPDSSGYRAPARLSEQLAYLRYVIAQYDGAPTAGQLSLITEYAQEMDAIDGDMAAVMRTAAAHAKI